MRLPKLLAIAASLVLILPSAGQCSPPARSAAWARPGAGAWAAALPLLRLPLLHPRANGTDHLLDSRRSVESFEFGEPAVALFLEIHGRVELERVVVEFEGGDSRSLDVFGVRRENGLFELMSFDGPRVITAVRVVGRSEHGRARIGVRLGV